MGKTPWRREWQPTPVLLPGKSHGQRRLVGDSPRGHKEPDTTEPLTLRLSFFHCVLSGVLWWKDNGSEFPWVPCFFQVPQALRCCVFTLTILRECGLFRSIEKSVPSFCHCWVPCSLDVCRSSWLIVLFKDSALPNNLLPCWPVYIRK